MRHAITRTDAATRELEDFRALIEERSGICFDSSRERFFQTRVLEHLQEKKMASVAELMRKVRASNVEYELLLQRLLTQETCFFRYPSAYEALKQLILPELAARKNGTKPRKVRIWSAGCATGEEPYSIAIALRESQLLTPGGMEAEILATDVSREAVGRAIKGIFPARSIANLTPDQIAANFAPVDKQFQLKREIRAQVSFVVMNLVQCLYMGRMDCIFCMNVLMYFSEDQRERVIRCFYDSLGPGGYLLLGHSESMGIKPAGFAKVVFDDCVLYRKPSGGNGSSDLGSYA
ncbi:MAG: protein-glutamate O-methyltransferase CheR [Terriglobia bacterium]